MGVQLVDNVPTAAVNRFRRGIANTYYLDVAFRRARLALEIDGFAHHSSREAFEHDRARQNQLMLAGWTVLRYTWPTLEHHPEVFVREVRQWLGRQKSVTDQQPKARAHSWAVRDVTIVRLLAFCRLGALRARVRGLSKPYWSRQLVASFRTDSLTRVLSDQEVADYRQGRQRGYYGPTGFDATIVYIPVRRRQRAAFPLALCRP